MNYKYSLLHLEQVPNLFYDGYSALQIQLHVSEWGILSMECESWV